MAIASYADLRVWRRSMDLVDEVYRASRGFPADERYGLVAQARRAAGSVPANIAEGHGRAHRAEYLQHLSVAASLRELETHAHIAARQGYLSADTLAALLATAGEVGRMLRALRRALGAKH